MCTQLHLQREAPVVREGIAASSLNEKGFDERDCCLLPASLSHGNSETGKQNVVCPCNEISFSPEEGNSDTCYDTYEC